MVKRIVFLHQYSICCLIVPGADEGSGSHGYEYAHGCGKPLLSVHMFLIDHGSFLLMPESIMRIRVLYLSLISG